MDSDDDGRKTKENERRALPGFVEGWLGRATGGGVAEKAARDLEACVVEERVQTTLAVGN